MKLGSIIIRALATLAMVLGIIGPWFDCGLPSDSGGDPALIRGWQAYALLLVSFVTAMADFRSIHIALFVLVLGLLPLSTLPFCWVPASRRSVAFLSTLGALAFFAVVGRLAIMVTIGTMWGFWSDTAAYALVLAAALTSIDEKASARRTLA
jgi:hypothetical protein